MRTRHNNETLTLCYPSCWQRNNHTSSHPKLLETNKSCLRTAQLLWFYFGCLFVGVYKVLHFYVLNVLKVAVTATQSRLSITSIALLHLSLLSVPYLGEGTNSDLQPSEVPASVMEWMMTITGIKQMWQRRTIADRGTQRECDDWLTQRNFFHC